LKQSEDAYKDSVNELTEYLPEWKTKIKTNYEEIQVEELQRSSVIVEQFRTYIKCIQLEENYISDMIKQIEEKFNQLDIERDMIDWIQINKMHSEPPLPPDFHPWNSETTKLTIPKPRDSVLYVYERKQFSKVSVSPTKEGNRGTFILGKDRTKSLGFFKPVEEVNDPMFMGWVRAMYDYNAEEPDELAFKEGAIIKLKYQDKSGWWTGELEGNTGLFPGNYVEFCFEPNRIPQ